jgi:prophage tail gpP-like protein
MARFYQVRAGDDLNSIATRFYGNPSDAPVIQAANPVISDPLILNTKWVLTIPDLPAEIDVKPSTPLVGGDKDEVSITVDNKQFYLWENVSITFSIDTMDSFQFSLPWDPSNEDLRKIFTPYEYKQVGVTIGGENVITGTIVKHDVQKSADASVITLSGYSLPGILGDVNPSPSTYPLEFIDNDLEQIAKRLCDPFSIKVVFDADKGAAFKRVAIAPTEKVLDFLIKLAQQRGLIVTSNPTGELVFQQTIGGKALFTLIEGQFPWISGNCSYDGQKRFSTITAIGDNFYGKETGSANAKDNTIKVNRSNVFNSNHITKGELQKSADAKIGRNFATSIGLGVFLTGWRDFDGNRLEKNTKIVYQAPSQFIYKETEFIIKDLTFTKEPDSLLSTLSLVFPEAYTGEIRSKFPWD